MIHRHIVVLGASLSMALLISVTALAQTGKGQDTGMQQNGATPPGYNVRDIPLDDAGLRALDQKHLRLARKSGTICLHMAPGGVVQRGSAPVPLDGCNMSTLDRLVAEQNNPALFSYHWSIRPGERYDQNRSGLYWQTVRTQILASHPELAAPKSD